MLAGIAKSGLYGAIVTEHLPLPETIDPQRAVSMHPDALAPYVEQLRTAAEYVQERNSQHSCPQAPYIVIGAEADWLNHDPAWTHQSVAEARATGVEVILGSVHLLDGWAFDDPSQLDLWDRRSVEDVWDQYFSEWIQAARSGLFDVMAHPDLPKKFGHRPAEPCQYYAEAAAAVADAGILCEVSTGGLRKRCAELYPAQDFIAELARRGVGMTIGSDAHAAAEIGYRFDYAAQCLLQAGVTYQSFPQGSAENRRITKLPLQ